MGSGERGMLCNGRDTRQCFTVCEVLVSLHLHFFRLSKTRVKNTNMAVLPVHRNTEPCQQCRFACRPFDVEILLFNLYNFEV